MGPIYLRACNVFELLQEIIDTHGDGLLELCPRMVVDASV